MSVCVEVTSDAGLHRTAQLIDLHAHNLTRHRWKELRVQTWNADRVEQLVVAVGHRPQMQTDLLRHELAREVEQVDVAPRLRIVDLKMVENRMLFGRQSFYYRYVYKL